MWHNFRKKLFNTKCVFWFSVQLLPETFLILRKNEIWSKIYIGFHVKCLSFFSDFNETWIFLVDFWKILKYQISRKSVRYWLSCSIQMNRQTGMTLLIVAFAILWKRLKIVQNSITQKKDYCQTDSHNFKPLLQKGRHQELRLSTSTVYMWKFYQQSS
jgi:hypothetical protein